MSSVLSLNGHTDPLKPGVCVCVCGNKMVDALPALPPVTSATLPRSGDLAGKQQREWLLFGRSVPAAHRPIRARDPQPAAAFSALRWNHGGEDLRWNVILEV